MATFVDEVVIHAAAGDGGHGCASVHREKFKPLGGPDGGNGGRGGDVVLLADAGTPSLLEYHHAPHRRATSGQPGQGGHRNGANGADVVLPVPVGTVVSVDGEVVADLPVAGASVVIARGGRGGLGNAALASSRRKAPGFALLGEPGETATVTLELKTVADIGLVGYPSAGKSSLIAAMSAARPKIADYPFTTLVPNLGVVTAGSTVYTVADVPGLIPGASQGRGLGLEFLRHVERCAALVHVLDCATLEPGRDPLSDLDIIEAELAEYGGLADRPRLVVLNKIDVPEGRDLAELVRPDIEARGLPVFLASAVSHEGLRELSFAMARIVAEQRAAIPEVTVQRIVIRPTAVDESGFEVVREGQAFRVRGERPERWIRQTDFSNDEAVGYLGDRLARLGVEDELVRLGATPGDEVRIGPQDNSVVFDWEPTVRATGPGPRGQDLRIDAPTARVHGRTRAQLEEGEEPEAGWAPDPVDEAPRVHRRAAAAGSTASPAPFLTRARPSAPWGRGPIPTRRIPDEPPCRCRRPVAGHSRGPSSRGEGRLVVVDSPGRRPQHVWGGRRARRSTPVLAGVSAGIDVARVGELVDALSAAGKRGAELVLVSSGAIATGIAPLGLRRRPRDLASAQAAASVGQGILMAHYHDAFGRHGRNVGQVLLTADDLIRRAHYRNAQRTLERLLELDVVPIVNENDTVATAEIRFGDNDRLAALVAHLVRADALILLSDVDGLYDGPPDRGGSALIREVASAADLESVVIGGTGSAGVGLGGMGTKVEAARIATEAGIPVVLTSAANAGQALAGQSVGTFFHATGDRSASRMLWLAHATASQGQIHLDAGAVRAVRERGAVAAAGGDHPRGGRIRGP